MVATLYIVMVLVVAGMNYTMKERKKWKTTPEDKKEETEEKVILSSSVRFSERRGAFSTLMSGGPKQCRKKVDV